MNNLVLELKVFKFSEYLNQKDIFFNTLTNDEKEKSQKFIKEIDRDHFIIGRGLLRKELSRILKISASKIQFSYSVEGKPLSNYSISFNVSHSHDYYILVLSDELLEVGIDIEKINASRNIELLIKRVLTQSEIIYYNQLSKVDKINFFYQRWTLKEAILKANGSGLLYPMEKIDLPIKQDSYIYIHENKKKYYSTNLIIDDMYCSIAASRPFEFIVNQT